MANIWGEGGGGAAARVNLKDYHNFTLCVNEVGRTSDSKICSVQSGWVFMLDCSIMPLLEFCEAAGYGSCCYL